MDQRSEYGHLPASYAFPVAVGIMGLIVLGIFAAVAVAHYTGHTPPLTFWGESRDQNPQK